MRDHRAHLGLGLAHREAPARDAVEGQRRDRRRALLAKARENPALHDPEERAAVSPERETPFEAAPRPAVRELHGRARGLLGRGIRRALVEDHRDVDSEVAELKIHRPFRREEVRRPVDVAPEENALLGELPASREGHHLIPAGVREDRPVPRDEAVEAAEAPDHVASGAEQEVVRVRQDDLGARGLEVAPARGLDGSRRADGHERGRLDDPVIERQAPAPRAARVTAEKLEAQHRL